MIKSLVGIDHTIVGVRDLEAARDNWARLGFTMTPRGSHIGWGTANYCIMFGRDYVELLGIVDPEAFTNKLDEFLADREGLLGLAFATSDGNALAGEMKAAAIAFEGPKDLKRNLELPEGTVLPEFKLVFPAAEAVPGLSAFICEHLTPDLVRRPAWLEHANGARAIKSVTVVAERPGDYRAAYEAMFGMGACVMTDDTLAVRTGTGLLLFVPPDDLETLHPEAEVDASVALPYAAVMTFEVGETDQAARALDAGGVNYHRLADGTVTVAAADANGVWLEFAAG